LPIDLTESLNMHSLRLATLTDLPRLVEIYNQAIASRMATADTTAFTVGMRRGWFEAHTPGTYPIYVSENESGRVVGYLSVSPYRDRPALNQTAEISYYVDYSQHGQGIGTRLMEYAIQAATGIHKRVYLAIVLEWNLPSLHLLEKFGFEKWGYLPEVADFSGKLCGHLYYGRKVSQAG
jgi:L-amino acid N-acyltransferase YncA